MGSPINPMPSFGASFLDRVFQCTRIKWRRRRMAPAESTANGRASPSGARRPLAFSGAIADRRRIVFPIFFPSPSPSFSAFSTGRVNESGLVPFSKEALFFFYTAYDGLFVRVVHRACRGVIYMFSPKKPSFLVEK